VINAASKPLERHTFPVDRVSGVETDGIGEASRCKTADPAAPIGGGHLDVRDQPTCRGRHGVLTSVLEAAG
jgi:hypothetical protein